MVKLHINVLNLGLLVAHTQSTVYIFQRFLVFFSLLWEDRTIYLYKLKYVVEEEPILIPCKLIAKEGQKS
jgi:hypothetical protein